MLVSDIIEIIEAVAPRWMACHWDRVGLAAGSAATPVTGILLCLDLTEAIVREAEDSGTNLIISHHPLALAPFENLVWDHYPGNLLAHLARSRISLYVAHTNWDHCRLSASGEILRRLGCARVRSCAGPPQQPGLLKLVTFVPEDSADIVRAALSSVGAGNVGEYSQCAFLTSGIGTFLGSPESSPTVGHAGQIERCPEIRLEMVCPPELVDQVAAALRAAHPYEEVAYDLIPLQGFMRPSHAIWRGELDLPIPLADLALLVDRQLGGGRRLVQFVGRAGRPITEIAAISGSGAGLLDSVPDDIEVIITGDFSHHHALASLRRDLAMIDLAHWSSECLVPELMADYLLGRITSPDLPVEVARQSTCPFQPLP